MSKIDTEYIQIIMTATATTGIVVTRHVTRRVSEAIFDFLQLMVAYCYICGRKDTRALGFLKLIIATNDMATHG